MSLIRALALTGGDWVVYALLICSVISIAAIIERAVIFYREERSLANLRVALRAAPAGGSLEKIIAAHEGAAGRILREALLDGKRMESGLEGRLATAGSEEKAVLEKRLLMLGTLGANAPFIGLFGTVLGVIKAFHDLSQANAGPEVVMQGLSEALIATAVGLFVAIPCVVAYNYLQKKLADLLGGAESLARSIGEVRSKEGQARA
jgi:biopolymer transport protein ExbB